MSILSDLLNHKITFSQAASEFVGWGDKIIANDPAATAAVGVIVADAKQAASDAVALAGTALGNLIAPATLAVEAAASGAMTAAIGPVGSALLTPAVDSAITTVSNLLKAEIDAAESALRASLKPSAA